MKTIRLLQLTDMHLFSQPNAQLLGVKTIESLTTVLDFIENNQQQPDLFVLTGDLSQDGSVASYEYMADVLQKFKIPCYFVPGNHDDPAALNNVFPRSNVFIDRHIILDGWQIILLNSQKEQEVAGYLAKFELDFLTKCLDQNPQLATIIMMHHPAWSVGSVWIDKLNLQNRADFFKIIKQHQNVKIVVSGHVHQEFARAENHVHYYSTPSTSIQFKPNTSHFSLDYQPQGYRIFNLYPDGKFNTTVYRMAEYIGRFETKAKGY